MGKKYIIEKDDNESIWSIYADADGDATIEGVSLTPYTEPDMEQVRKEGYQEGYRRALADVREEHVCQTCVYFEQDENEEPCVRCPRNFLDQYTPKPKQEEIKVGDEVNAPFGKAIVVNIDSVAEKIWLVYADGHGGFEYFKDAPTKTGRHFPEIAEVLQKMKEE